MARIDLSSKTVDGVVTTALLMEERFSPLPESVKVLQEFRGFSDYTYVCDNSGRAITNGIHTLVQGDFQDLSDWLDQNAPVWVTKGSPMFEQFSRWSGPKLDLTSWELEQLYHQEWPKERKVTGQRRFGQWFVNHFKIEGHPDLFYMTNNVDALHYCREHFLVKRAKALYRNERGPGLFERPHELVGPGHCLRCHLVSLSSCMTPSQLETREHLQERPQFGPIQGVSLEDALKDPEFLASEGVAEILIQRLLSLKGEI